MNYFCTCQTPFLCSLFIDTESVAPHPPLLLLVQKKQRQVLLQAISGLQNKKSWQRILPGLPIMTVVTDVAAITILLCHQDWRRVATSKLLL